MKRSVEKAIRGREGFTLIEIIMVIVLLAIISTTAALIITTGANSYAELGKRSDLTMKGRAAVERITREVRLVRCSDTTPSTECLPDATDITTSTSTEVAFVNTNDQVRGVRLNGTTVEVNVGGTYYVLVDDVTAFNIDYLDNTGAATAVVNDMWAFEVTFTVTDANQSLDFTTRVHPRGFL